VFKAKGFAQNTIFVPAILLCPQAKTAFVETKKPHSR
jgi:hypothetical protein